MAVLVRILMKLKLLLEYHLSNLKAYGLSSVFVQVGFKTDPPLLPPQTHLW